MGYRRRHRSHSREESSERSDGRSRLKTSTERVDGDGGDDATSSTAHRSSSSRHHHRSHHHRSSQSHSEGRPRRRRERPEWLKLILSAQRQFVGAILMTVGLCLSRGAQLVSAMLLGPRAQPVEERPHDRPSAGSADFGPPTSTSSTSDRTVATRGSGQMSTIRTPAEDGPRPYAGAIVAPEDLD